MAHLGDTNILLRFTNSNDPQHALVRDAIRLLALQGESLYYTQQSRREFWNVCTRPVERNGLGYTTVRTQQRLAEVDAVFQRLPDRPESGPIWDRLVARYEVVGVSVHDAQLVATMLAHGIPTLLTLNDRDFARYVPEISVVHPGSVCQPAVQREQQTNGIT
jgi:predicted nucleic acid-binding protein